MDGSYIQCQHCGHIYQVEYVLESDVLVTKMYCPICMHDKGLNLGEDKDDIYYYRNVNIDARYY